jgi:DNA-directed RNA polymerase specialized sigma24 family protein
VRIIHRRPRTHSLNAQLTVAGVTGRPRSCAGARLGADERVAELLEQLAPDQATAVRARVIDERPYGEIATSMRCSEAVVRKRVSRGLAHLRVLLRGPHE